MVKVTKDELLELEKLRTDELAKSIPLTKYNRTFFYTLNELIGVEHTSNWVETLSVDKLKYIVEYLNKVIEINEEVRKFNGFITSPNDKYIMSIDFNNKIYVNDSNIDNMRSYIKKLENIIKDKSLVECPENLKHLIPKLKKDKKSIIIDFIRII